MKPKKITCWIARQENELIAFTKKPKLCPGWNDYDDSDAYGIPCVVGNLRLKEGKFAKFKVTIEKIED